MAKRVNTIFDANSSGFRRALDGMQKGVNDFETRVSKFRAGLGAAFDFAGIGTGIQSLINLGGELYDLSRSLGISSESFQRLKFAADQNSVSQEQLVGMIRRFNEARDQALRGNEPLVASFDRLGISINDLQTLRPDELILKIGKAIEQVPDVSPLLATLQAVGGEGAVGFVTAFRGGLEAQFKEFDLTGGLIKEKDVIALKDAAGSLTNLKVAFISAFTPLANFVANILEAAEVLLSVVRVISPLARFLGLGNSSKEAAENVNRVIARYDSRQKNISQFQTESLKPPQSYKFVGEQTQTKDQKLLEKQNALIEKLIANTDPTRNPRLVVE